MKREELKALGLTDEQVESVMSKSGAEIATLNSQISTLKSEKSQLENEKNVLTQEKVDKEKALSDLQKDSITKSEYDAKIKEIEDKSKKETEDYIYNDILCKELSNSKVINSEKNVKAVKSALDLDKISLDKDKKTLIGFKEQIEELKKTDPQFFNVKAKGYEPANPDGNDGDESNINAASSIAKEANSLDISGESKFFN